LNKVYFLENIEINSENQDYSHITLFDASLYYESDKHELSQYFSTLEIQNNNILISYSSGFVYFKNNVITNANGNSIARHFRYQNTRLRGFLIKNSSNEVNVEKLSNNIYSYHVNVGHGNCSFVVDQDKQVIWAIDCSNYDYLIKSSYQANIQFCIDHIKNKFGLSDFRINYFVLTHPHFDHYSGIDNLINMGAVNSNTIIYLNQYYSMPNPIFNRILKRIVQLGSKTVEPLIANSNPTLEILYPSNRVVKTKTTIYNHLNPIIAPKPNNASVVFNLKSSQNTFLFTGDIETTAWDTIGTCVPYLRECNFYAVSHHGSINGHLRNYCVVNKSINSVSDCLDGRALPIIMGRTNSYLDVPSPRVLSDFGNVVYSEKDQNGKNAKFLELDWSNKILNWH